MGITHLYIDQCVYYSSLCRYSDLKDKDKLPSSKII